MMKRKSRPYDDSSLMDPGFGCWNSSSNKDSDGHPQFKLSRAFRSFREKDSPFDPVAPTTTEADALLVQEMNSLTIEERNKVYEEIHGVNHPVEETPELIQSSLAMMQAELDRLRQQKKKKVTINTVAFDKALFFVPHRVQDEAMRLQFLRCEEFDAVRAAHRFVRFFDLSYEMFGMEGLLRDVQLRDLNQDDLNMINTASVQPMFDVTDRSGRPIFLFLNTFGQSKSATDMVRAGFYMFVKALQNPDAQKKGVVWISWNTGLKATSPKSNNNNNKKRPLVSSASATLIKLAMAFFKAIPIRLAAIHYCYNNAALQPVVEFLKLVTGRQGRVRFRTHFGSPLEVRYQLMGYGVDASRFPLSTDGQFIAKEKFHAWIDSLRRQEEEDMLSCENEGHAVQPRSTDVLMGRGQPFRLFPGNQRLAQVVEDHWNTYESSTKRGKTQLVQDLVQQMLEQEHVRFLERTSSSTTSSDWHVVSPDRAFFKVASTFRNKRVVDRYHLERQQQHAAAAAAATPEPQLHHPAGAPSMGADDDFAFDDIEEAFV